MQQNKRKRKRMIKRKLVAISQEVGLLLLFGGVAFAWIWFISEAMKAFLKLG